MRIVWILAIIGCSGSKDGTDDPTPETGDTATTTGVETGDTGTVPSSELIVAAENVHSATVSFSVPTGTVREGWDALVSWNDVTTDLWGEPLDPVSVPVLALLEVFDEPQDLPERLAADDLGADLLSVWTAEVAGETFAHLSDLSSGSLPFAPDAYLVEEQGKTWLLALAVADGARLDLRAMVALEVAAAGDASLLLADGAAATATVAFDGAPVTAPAGVADLTADWSGLAADAFGKPYDPDLGDELFLARFDQPATALGASALALREHAQVWYAMEVTRRTDARLELARDAGSATFPGFDTSGTWLMGVRCTTCLTRLPLWAVVLDVR